MNQQRSANQVKMFDLFKLIVLLILIVLLLWAWFTRPQPKPIVEATAPPTEQPAPPATDTPLPPTNTPAPTDTPVPPTATTAPTEPPAPTPTEPAPAAPPTVSLPENATAGTVMLSGSGEPGSTVEIMLDGKSLGTATVGADGRWQFPADMPDAGDFSLSVRSLAADGSVLAESEPQTLTVAAPTLMPEGEAYIVQANDWLSKLADKFYGDPFAYDAIVTATNDMAATDDSFTVIENPDLIEIGQKLWIPPAP